VKRLKEAETSYPNLIATATALTATTIAAPLRGMSGDLIVSGGGVHNRQLMGQIAALLPQLQVTTSADYGIDPDAKEAIAFAVLAHETWRRRASNLPSATGARHTVVLGSITPG
jgi:anhydro-N-acetylmuramic acid kinase